MTTTDTPQTDRRDAEEFARRHGMPPPDQWVEWVSEVRDYPEVDERHALCSQYLAKLR